jgi:hypothetical protein
VDSTCQPASTSPVKLDYLKDGSDDCPLVRLYEFDSSDAQRLRQTFQALADGSIERVRLEAVESVDGTQLTFIRSTRNRRVVETGLHQFEVALTPEYWRWAADLTEPFCDGGFGYQWLPPQTSDIKLLLSKNGTW